MKTRYGLCAVAAALFSGGLFAASGAWTSEGPYGGSVFRLFVNPSSPSVLYAGTTGGIFRSDDAGVSWVRKEAGLADSPAYTYALGMDADTSGTLWVVDGFGHFDRSTDGGDNWAQTGYSLPANDTVTQIADAPGMSGTLYLATNLNGVLVSINDGASFTPSNVGLPSGVPINALAVDPSNAQRLIAGTGSSDLVDPVHQASLYLSIDGGASWSDTLALGGSSPYYGQVSDISFGAGTTIYAVVDQSLYRSDDDGATWNGPLSDTYYSLSVHADPSNANTVLIGGYDGVTLSTDGGVTGTAYNSGLAVTAGVPAAVQRIVVHPDYPTTPQLWLATVNAGIFFSASGGSSWATRDDGLAAVGIRALAMFHDASTHRMFAGYGDAFTPSPALYRGNNTGPGTPFASWAPSNTNLGAYQIRSITIDPTTRSSGIGNTRIYATGRSGIGYAGALDVRNGGIYRSLDGGNTWATIDAGLPTRGSPPAANVGTVRSLVLDPRSCAVPPPSGSCVSGPLQTLYATTNGRSIAGTYQFRIIKSINGGDSWSSSDSGIPQSFDGTPPDYNDYQQLLVVPIVIDPSNPQVLYAGTTTLYDPNLVSTPTVTSGVFKSTDGGVTWVNSSNGLPLKAGSTDTAYDVLSLAINPSNPLELWCSVVDANIDTAAGGGVYHTTDGGANWVDSSAGLTSVDIRALDVDANDPTVVYAAGGGTAGNPGGIYKSTDSGANWLSISVGLPADAATALQIDPVDSTVLYAGTSSGVWSLTQVLDTDGDGVPDVVEDAAPNGGDGNNDGIPDSQEPNVGSLASASSNQPAGRNVPDTVNPYFTVSVTPVVGTCAQAVDVQSVYAAYNGNDVSGYGDNYAYPRQLARFEITDCQKATVTLKFHNAAFGSGYSMRFYGPSTPGDPATMGWYDFSSRATQVAPDTWQLTLDNGQFGSYRPATANSILFEGGPAFENGIFKNGFD